MNQVWLHGNNISNIGLLRIIKVRKYIRGLWIYGNLCEYQGWKEDEFGEKKFGVLNVIEGNPITYFSNN